MTYIPLSRLNSSSHSAQCLYVLTDDNQIFTNELRNNSEYTGCLLQAVHTDTPLSLDQSADLPEVRVATLRILIVGILRNISPLPQRSPAESNDLDKTVALPVLQPVISSLSLSQCSEAVQTIINQEVLYNDEAVSRLTTCHIAR